MAAFSDMDLFNWMYISTELKLRFCVQFCLGLKIFINDNDGVRENTFAHTIYFVVFIRLMLFGSIHFWSII